MSQTPQDFMHEYERETSQHHLEETLSLIDDGAVYLFSDGSVHIGKPAIEQVLKRNFNSIIDETYIIANLTWLVYTPEAAACVYDFTWSGILYGEPASGSGRGTSVLKRAAEGWKVIHEHLSRGKFIA